MTVARRRGRPPRITGEPATERVWVWLTPSERRALEHVAEESGLSIAELAREAINEWVADCSERRVFSVTGNSRPAVS